jgi:hypothetical protein
MNEYTDPFITTFTGKQFHFLDPQPDEIDIEDIAHALSLSCRYQGQCRVFYSVAEHCIRVAEIVHPRCQLEALLHDAAEAYIPDIPRPIKVSFGMREYENKILAIILKKFGAGGITPAIRQADNIIMATECRDLMANINGWARLPQPLRERIEPIDSRTAEILFLDRFEAYKGGKNEPEK